MTTAGACDEIVRLARELATERRINDRLSLICTRPAARTIVEQARTIQQLERERLHNRAEIARLRMALRAGAVPRDVAC